jgi:hypothetical protein
MIDSCALDRAIIRQENRLTPMGLAPLILLDVDYGMKVESRTDIRTRTQINRSAASHALARWFFSEGHLCGMPAAMRRGVETASHRDALQGQRRAARQATLYAIASGTTARSGSGPGAAGLATPHDSEGAEHGRRRQR